MSQSDEIRQKRGADGQYYLPVYVKSSNNTSRTVYHTDPDCLHLEQAASVLEKHPDAMAHLDPCSRCSEEA